MIGQDTPANANSGRREYFRELMRRKLTAYVLVLGGVGAFVFGASQRDPLILVGAPFALAVLVLGVAAILADRHAARNFYLSFSEAAGLEYIGHTELLPYTPLLGAGDRQHCENWMTGNIVHNPPMTGGLGHFVYEELKETALSNGNERKSTVERQRITICMVDMEESILMFKGIFLRQHRGLLNLQHDWLSGTGTHKVEMESSAFTGKYELRIAADQDELLLRQLFSPTLVEWLAGHPLSPGFELRGGTLVVFVPRPLDDGGNLTFLLDATREITRRVLGEVREAVDRAVPNAKIAGL
jgi:hypothetical protein